MSLAPFQGKCYHCGHDHDESNRLFRAAFAKPAAAVPECGSITLEQALTIVEKAVNAWKAQNMDLVAHAIGALKADFIVADRSFRSATQERK